MAGQATTRFRRIEKGTFPSSGNVPFRVLLPRRCYFFGSLPQTILFHGW